MNITGTVVVDLTDLDRYEVSGHARSRLSCIEQAPAGSRVVIRTGCYVPTGIELAGIHRDHLGDIDIEATDADVIRAWIAVLRGTQ